MSATESDRRISRRDALALGGGLAAGLLAAGGPLAGPAAAASGRTLRTAAAGGTLPYARIQQIVGVEGEVSSKGVLDMSVSRIDIGQVAGPLGVPFSPDFEIHGDVYFQPLKTGGALVNADMALLPQEVNPFIAALLGNGLVFQAFHQHFPMMQPQVWFVHYRGIGDPIQLAQAVRAAIATTATPLPQTLPSHPTTPLDAARLGSILHGSVSVGGEGVVTVVVPRIGGVALGGVHAFPDTNISTNIEFRPIDSSATAWVVPDFSMTADDVDQVVRLMMGLGWFQGCLYNQETDERPQLYFDHMLKQGNAYTLAMEVRRGLDLTHAR